MLMDGEVSRKSQQAHDLQQASLGKLMRLFQYLWHHLREAEAYGVMNTRSCCKETTLTDGKEGDAINKPARNRWPVNKITLAFGQRRPGI